MQTMFRHKPEFHFNKFTVEKTVIIPARKLEEMLRHPMLDHQATRDNAGVMGVDGDGVYHCLLVMGEGRTDGLLVQSEGSGYARYASYVPEATALRYPTLSRLNQELAEVADFIIAEGTRQTTGGNWTASFDELEDETGLCVEEKPFLQETLADMLLSRPEVADLTIGEGQFDVVYHLDFCPNCQKEDAPENLPDRISMEEMCAYGYSWEGMLPLGREMALKLAGEGLEVFLLMPDGTECVAEGRDGITAHDGLYGVERQAWQDWREAQGRVQTQGAAPSM
ncbi:DUF6329 domain-containing protein [Lachnospiraceae bacterium 54-11]